MSSLRLRLLALALAAAWPASASQRSGPPSAPIPSLPLSAALAPPRFTAEFGDAVAALSKRKGGERWSERDWSRLDAEIRQFRAGAPSAAEPARLGPAAEAGV